MQPERRARLLYSARIACIRSLTHHDNQSTSYITASSETTLTLGNGLDNDSAKPDGDWQNHQAKFVFTRGSNNASLTFTFVNA